MLHLSSLYSMKSTVRRTKRQAQLVLNRAGNSGKSVRQSLTFNLQTKLIRNATMEGRNYVVVPMVMLTEGVHRGSNGAMLYPAEELSKTPVVWNMKPLVVNHPEANGVGLSATDPEVAESYKVGLIMNTRFEDGKLKAEAWVEEERADKVDDRIMEAIRNEEMMELSTGVFVDADGDAGEWNGEPYDCIARNYRPDHLAILPDKRGACSIADGAGFIRNRSTTALDAMLETVTTYADEFPVTNKAAPQADEASRAAIKSGAWAVIRGTKKGHDKAAVDHEKASRLHEKAKNKDSAAWHTQKAADHKSWGDEIDEAPVKNDVVSDAGSDTLDQDAEQRAAGEEAVAESSGGPDIAYAGKWTSDAANAAAVERSQNAMRSKKASAHKGAAIAHRVAASRFKAEANGADTLDAKLHTASAKLHDVMAKNCEVTDNELSFDDTRMKLSEELRADDPQNCTCWVMDVYEDYFVYSDGKGKFFKQSYSAEDNSVEIEGEPEAVVRVTSYEPARNQHSVTNMNKKQMIDALITNHGWEKDDREFLNGRSDKRVKALYDQAVLAKNSRTAKDHANVSDADEDPDAADNQDDKRTAEGKGGKGKRGVGEIIGNDGAADDDSDDSDDTDDAPPPAKKAAPFKKKKATMNEYIAGLPAEVQEVIRNGIDAGNRERSKLVAVITANESNEFTEEELNAMPLKSLARLAKLARNATAEQEEDNNPFTARPRFDGQGETMERNEEGAQPEVLAAPVMNFDEEKK